MCASRFPIYSFISVHSSRSTSVPLAVAVAVLLAASPARAQGELQIAELGDCELESGAVIENCRVGYRTSGQLDADGSNAVLFPAWFSGTSEQVAAWWVGPDKFVDDSEWFVIAVDPIGQKMYWLESYVAQVCRANLDGSEIEIIAQCDGGG